MRRRDFIVAVGGVIVSPPIAARAQKSTIPVVGYLGAVAQRPNLPFTAAFFRGLVETGFTEGRDFIVDYRWAEGNLDRLPALAAELVSDHVAVIFASGGVVSARAAMQATSSISNCLLNWRRSGSVGVGQQYQSSNWERHRSDIQLHGAWCEAMGAAARNGAEGRGRSCTRRPG